MINGTSVLRCNPDFFLVNCFQRSLSDHDAYMCICSFVLRSVSIVDITGLSETEEVHTIGDTSYTIHDDTVLVSRESDVCSISSSESSESSEDENET